MSRSKRLTLGLALLVLSSARGFAAEEESTLRALAQQFYTTFSNRDLNAFMAFWAGEAPYRERMQQAAQQVFSSYTSLTLAALSVQTVTVKGNKAQLRVDRQLKGVAAKTGKETALDQSIRALEFVREGEQWKVWRETAAVEDLAESLIAAKTDTEREALLAADRGLVGMDLRRMVLAMGEERYRTGNYPAWRELFSFVKGMSERIQDDAGVALALRDMGLVHKRTGDYAAAIDSYRKSLEIGRRLGNPRVISSVLEDLSDVYRLMGDYEEALKCERETIELYERLGDRAALSGAYVQIGNVHYSHGDLDEAINLFQLSLNIAEEFKDKTGMAIVLNNLGLCHYVRGEYARALERLSQSAKYYDELGDNDGVGRALNNTGLVHMRRGDYGRALDAFTRSLQIRERLGNRAGTANAWSNIGDVYLAQRNHAQALHAFQQSLKLSEELPAKPGIALALERIGTVYRLNERYEEARDRFERSVALNREMGDERAVASVLLEIAEIRLRSREYGEALSACRESLAIAERSGDREAAARTLQALAEIYLAQGDAANALLHARRAGATSAEIDFPEGRWRAEMASAKALRLLERTHEAREALEHAIRTVEDLRTRIAGAETQQQGFFQSTLAPYHELLDLLLSEGNAGAALEYAERGKARTLLDTLQTGRASLTKTMSVSEEEQERRISAGLVSLNLQVTRERQREKPTAARLAALQARVADLRLEQERFQTALYAAHPELKIQRGEIAPVTIHEAAGLLPHRMGALLEYVVTASRTYLFVITRRENGIPDVKPYVLDVTASDLTSRVEQFRGQLANRDLGFRPLARELHRLLLEPAADALKEKTAWIVSPDNALWELPFQALLSPAGQYVEDDVTVTYAPSLTALREMRRLQARRRRPGRGNLLVVANPAARSPGESAATLMTEAQVAELRGLYGTSRSRVLTGAEATEGRFKAEAPHYAVLHLATHGSADSASPLYSYVVMAQPARPGNEDALLEAGELMQLNLNADLAVLSACETGRGRTSAGEGLIGLSWALFVAGVPTAVVSQWKVDASGAAALMLAFHREIRKGIAPGDALRLATKKLRENPSYRHPFYWAPFVATGAATLPIFPAR